MAALAKWQPLTAHMEYEIGAALRFDTLTGRRAGRWANGLSDSQLGTLRVRQRNWQQQQQPSYGMHCGHVKYTPHQPWKVELPDAPDVARLACDNEATAFVDLISTSNNTNNPKKEKMQRKRKTKTKTNGMTRE